MLIYALGEDSEAAQRKAKSTAEGGGWMMVHIKRGKALDPDPTLVEDEILRRAMETALAKGSAIVVYADELRADA